MKRMAVSVLVTVLLALLAGMCMAHATHAVEGVVPPRHLKFVAPWPRADRETQRLIRVYAEAFARLGMTFEVRDVPCRRASERVDNGLVDGELSRVAGYGRHFRNIVRVDEPHHTKGMVAYAVREGIRLDGWASLAGVDLRVECPRGVVSCNDNVVLYVPPDRYSVNDTLEQSLLRLREGRIDVYITTEGRVEEYLRASAIGSPGGTGGEGRDGGTGRVPRVYAAGVMKKEPGYMWLHKKHAALAPAIAATLRDMKRDGTFARLYGAE